MRLANCIICKENVTTSNAKDGICVICWQKIRNGEEPAITSYLELDVLIEAFPKSRGRFLE